MKKLLLCCTVAVLSGCESATSYGPCVGIVGDKDPQLVYKLSVQNTVVGVVFSGLLFIPPAFVLADETFCPVGKRSAP